MLKSKKNTLNLITYFLAQVLAIFLTNHTYILQTVAQIT